MSESALQIGPCIRHMKLELWPDLAKGCLRAKATLQVGATKPGDAATLILNHGMRACSLRIDGINTPYTQDVADVYDHEWVPVRRIFFTPDHDGAIALEYEGEIENYRQIWSYVRDGISPEFSIFREDAFAYPMVAWRAQDGVYEVQRRPFTHEIHIWIPGEQTALCGGWAREIKKTAGGGHSFVYASQRAEKRLDVVVGHYRRYEGAFGDHRLYLLDMKEKTAQDERRARQLLVETDACRALFRHLFGVPRSMTRHLALIEVPNGYGGQAMNDYILQQSYAFENENYIDGIYHEIGHGWTTAQATGLAAGKRFFDESFASYFQVLAMRCLHGPYAEEAVLHKMQEQFAQVYEQVGAQHTTLAHHGHEHYIAYTKGAWMLRQMQEIMGERAFLDAVREFIHVYDEKAAGFPDFVAVMEKHAALPIGPMLNDWIFGVESSHWLATLYSKKG